MCWASDSHISRFPSCLSLVLFCKLSSQVMNTLIAAVFAALFLVAAVAPHGLVNAAECHGSVSLPCLVLCHCLFVVLPFSLLYLSLFSTDLPSISCCYSCYFSSPLSLTQSLSTSPSKPLSQSRLLLLLLLLPPPSPLPHLRC